MCVIQEEADVRIAAQIWVEGGDLKKRIESEFAIVVESWPTCMHGACTL